MGVASLMMACNQSKPKDITEVPILKYDQFEDVSCDKVDFPHRVGDIVGFCEGYDYGYKQEVCVRSILKNEGEDYLDKYKKIHWHARYFSEKVNSLLELDTRKYSDAELYMADRKFSDFLKEKNDECEEFLISKKECFLFNVSFYLKTIEDVIEEDKDDVGLKILMYKYLLDFYLELLDL